MSRVSCCFLEVGDKSMVSLFRGRPHGVSPAGFPKPATGRKRPTAIRAMRTGRCRQAEDCGFCHLDHEGTVKLDKRQREIMRSLSQVQA